MSEIPKDFRLESLFKPADFTAQAARLGQRAVIRVLILAAALGLVLFLLHVFYPEAMPTPTAMLKALGSRRRRRNMSDEEALQGLVGWVLVVLCILAFTVASALYVKRMRYRTIVDYCDGLGLHYILSKHMRLRISAEPFEQRELVPEYDQMVVDDLIGWTDNNNGLIFSEVRLLAQGMFQRYATTVFSGALLFVQIKEACLGDLKYDASSLTYEKSGRGEWHANDQLSDAAPELWPFLKRIGTLATVLCAEEVKTAKAGNILYVSIRHPRDAFPVPPFWHRWSDAKTFDKLAEDLRTIADLAHALVPGVKASKPIRSVPPKLERTKSLIPLSAILVLSALALLIAITLFHKALSN